MPNAVIEVFLFMHHNVTNCTFIASIQKENAIPLPNPLQHINFFLTESGVTKIPFFQNFFVCPQGNDSGDDGGTFSHSSAHEAAPHITVSQEQGAARVTHDTLHGTRPTSRGSISTIGSFTQSQDGGDKTSRKSFNASMNNYLEGSEGAPHERSPSASAGDNLPGDLDTGAVPKSGPAEGQLIDFASNDDSGHVQHEIHSAHVQQEVMNTEPPSESQEVPVQVLPSGVKGQQEVTHEVV